MGSTGQKVGENVGEGEVEQWRGGWGDGGCRRGFHYGGWGVQEKGRGGNGQEGERELERASKLEGETGGRADWAVLHSFVRGFTPPPLPHLNL